MNEYELVIKIGCTGYNEDEVLDKYADILFFVQENVNLDNYSISVDKIGEYVDL